MGQDLHETTIKIRGASYQLRTDMPDARLKELAEYVDDTMKALDPKAAVPPGKLSVLASLSIAGELMDERSDRESFRTTMEERVTRMSQLLDQALGDDATK